MFQQQIQSNIDRVGQHVFGIFPTSPDDEGFLYTIGNALRGLPELLIVGNIPLDIGCMILNVVGDHMRKSEKTLDEGFLDLDWTFPFKIRKCSDRAKEEYTVQCGQFLGREDYDVLQVMICDKAGKYPGEEGVDPRYDVNRP